MLRGLVDGWTQNLSMPVSLLFVVAKGHTLNIMDVNWSPDDSLLASARWAARALD